MITNTDHMLIDAQHLTYQYNTGELAHIVLKDASIDVKAGEIVILVGPSGSGKSTLLSLIGALRTCQAGHLTVLGENLKLADDAKMHDIRKNMGYVFQQHNLLKFLTASQNVQMTLEMFPEISPEKRRSLADEILGVVGLQDYLDYYPSQLSVGQKQRVAIARSLVHSPKVIMADEPTASLDSKSGIHVVEILHSMVKNMGCGALIVTHDHRIFEYADRILHIEDGVVSS